MRQLSIVNAGSLAVALTAGFIGSALGQQISPSVSTSATFSSGVLTTETRLDQSSSVAFFPDRVIVRFKSGAPSFLPGSGRAVELSRARNTHLVVNPPGLAVRDALARYRQNPNVEFAEPDYLVQAIADVTPNDTSYTQQWDMPKISAPTVWGAAPDTTNTVVAIVDTGIDLTHEDLANNIVNMNGVRGYTCIGGSCVAGGADDHGHGTHVAGTIGGIGNNGTGVAGLNWSIKLLAIKFLNSSGSGAISDAILGFEKILELKTAGVPIRVTNNSWGGGGYSQALKNAMAAVETAGVLNVCAAGNSGVNADITPMYPAAYDNRGIVSVLASDASDAAASFSNYGVASVDIAAPGVSIYSSVPKFTCSLCDATGYKFLSGTSMASPHVAGVAAAMMASYPLMKPFEARDALLDPGSYDVPVGASAQRTSSGGRLNFARVLSNSGKFVGREASNQLNQFPTVTVGPDAFVSSGASVSFTQTATDLDAADIPYLKSTTGRGPVSNWTAWLFGWRANVLYPTSTPFTAPTVARMAAMPYDTSVSDSRGGGASGRNWAIVAPFAGASTTAPSISLTVPTTGTVGVAVPISVSASPGAAWDLNASGTGGSSGRCCLTGNSTSLTFNSAGVYRITAQAIDGVLNTSPMDGSATSELSSKVIAISAVGGLAPTGNPPIAAISLGKKDGVAPFSVTVDASASRDLDGTISTYFFDCGVGYASGQTATSATCNFNQPGTYWVRVLVTDNSNMMGIAADYVVVSPPPPPPPPPPPGGDVTPPTVSFSSPANGASITAATLLRVLASDNIGVTSVEYRLDGQILATVTTGGSFDYQFDPSLYAYGSHSISAIAQDAMGNKSNVATIGVTTVAPFVAPAIALSPSGNITVQFGKARSFTATLSNASTNPLGAVFYTVEGSSGIIASYSQRVTTLPSFTYVFNSKGLARGIYKLYAQPYDSKGNVGPKTGPVTITLK